MGKPPPEPSAPRGAQRIGRSPQRRRRRCPSEPTRGFVASLVLSVSNATRARSWAISACAVRARPLAARASRRAGMRGSAGPARGRAPTPAACAGRSPGPRRSLAASHPGVDRYSSTAWRRNSTVLFLRGHDRGSSRFPGRGRIQRDPRSGVKAPGSARISANPSRHKPRRLWVPRTLSRP